MSLYPSSPDTRFLILYLSLTKWVAFHIIQPERAFLHTAPRVSNHLPTLSFNLKRFLALLSGFSCVSHGANSWWLAMSSPLFSMEFANQELRLPSGILYMARFKNKISICKREKSMYCRCIKNSQESFCIPSIFLNGFQGGCVVDLLSVRFFRIHSLIFQTLAKYENSSQIKKLGNQIDEY